MTKSMRTRSVSAAAIVIAAAGALEANEWRIAAIDGVATEGEARITFNADGSFGGSTGCNQFQAAGELVEGRLQVEGPIATTQMACPGETWTRQEDTILALLDGEIEIAFDPFADQVTLSRGGISIALVAPGVVSVPDPAPQPQPEPPDLFDAPFVNVFGISSNLNIHADPSVSSGVVGKTPAGTLFRNKGCQTGGAHDWCNVVFLDSSGREGWAAAEYLEPADATLRLGQGVFDQIGTLTCVDSANAPLSKCDFGLARDPDGTAVLAVFRPDGFQRLLTFVDGEFAFTDSSEAGGGFDASASRDGDRTIVLIDAERYEVPDVLLSTE